ncbi:MAG: SAM-dependent methyltransferase [Bryobacteraceae bacterium]
MRELPWISEFDGAYCFGNSFCYLDRVNAAAFLDGIARALKPGGRFAVETGMAAESILPGLVKTRWFKAGDIFMLSKN